MSAYSNNPEYYFISKVLNFMLCENIFQRQSLKVVNMTFDSIINIEVKIMNLISNEIIIKQ